jgi:hypothetical protein
VNRARSIPSPAPDHEFHNEACGCCPLPQSVTVGTEALGLKLPPVPEEIVLHGDGCQQGYWNALQVPDSGLAVRRCDSACVPYVPASLLAAAREAWMAAEQKAERALDDRRLVEERLAAAREEIERLTHER